jgi:hypothetical protein
MTSKIYLPINIYCDESRHTSDPADAYFVIGGIACPREKKRELVHKVHLLKQKYNTQGEFGWKRLSPNRRDFYFAVLDMFIQEPDLSFRCIVVDKNNLDHDRYNEGDPELGFYKFYYQMLVHWLKPACSYHIYLDWQQNKVQHRFSALRDILGRKLSGRAKIACLEPVGSKHIPMIEMADLLIGAVGYEWNGRTSSQVKVEFCESLAKSLKISSLKSSTFSIKDKFDIFHFTGR